MPLSSQPDHVAIAVPDIEAALSRWRGDLGAGLQWRFHNPMVFRGAQLGFAGGAKLEVLMPSDAGERTGQLGGPSGFVDQFLQRFGARVHHVTLKVPDLDDALSTLTRAGLDAVDIDRSDEHWQEAFLRPSQIGGLIVQVAWSPLSDEDWAEREGHEVEDPDPGGARLRGPLLTHDDLDAAARVWSTLGGDVEREDDVVTARWDDEILEVVVRAGPRPDALGLRFDGLTEELPADEHAGPAALHA